MRESIPTPKEFDNSGYQNLINSLSENMAELEFERRTEVVVYDILENYENFRGVEKGPNFRGTPFDFFGYKNDLPYIIEYKSSLNNFNTPGETQKRRLKEILNEIAELNIALLQVKLSKGQYRILYDEELKRILDTKKAPIEPIIDWIKDRI
jgi:hypothetical protein